MTISEQKKQLERYVGKTEIPADFKAFWQLRWKNAAPVKIRREKVPFLNPVAVYENLSLTNQEGETLRARHLRPAGEGEFPTLLVYHDISGIKGWHNLTRFVALGYAVLALENRVDGSAETLEAAYRDALTLAQAALLLPETNKAQIACWGDGLGGGLALAAAAMLPNGAPCAVQNPMPGDFDEKSYLDAVGFAACLKKPLLLATGMLDTTAPVSAQYAVFNRAACPKTHKIYPKYGHEQIMFFEDVLLEFLLTNSGTCDPPKRRKKASANV